MVLNKKNISIVLGWIITILILVYIVSKLDFSQFLEHLKKVSYFDLFVLTIIYLIGFVIRGVRTKIMLPSLNFKQALGGIFLGYAANNVLPARLGEVLRAQVIGKHSNISRSTTLSNILVERILDGVAIVILLFWGSMALSLPSWANKLKYVGLAIFTVAILGLFLINFLNLKYKFKFPNNFPGNFLKNFLEGFRLSMKTPKTFIYVLFISIFIWTFEALIFYYGLVIFDLPKSFHLACFVLGTVNLAALVPSSPGAVGLFEGTAIKTLEIFGVSMPLALAYSSVVHACQLIPVIFIGIGFMKYFGLKSLKIS
ncbi:MAG: lysylphosphatidylglycerol synthase transmembrane domain-containing protein [Bdellovibrionota bacterium]|nr:lysylphosphatidylglycerol synthase transmembrane domain-containing protein [Pseudomonadota bacterium]MDY6091543.1 lysylphosphatidylglycerol synthase transmembrane domain-containing protein [Bdellovibrionota bacterium]